MAPLIIAILIILGLLQTAVDALDQYGEPAVVIEWPVPEAAAPVEPRDEPHQLATVESAPTYYTLARCGPSCWGERLSRGEVESLATRATGDPAWARWAAQCFTGGGENRGYVGAVGGPNSNGSFDLGIGQSNTGTLAHLGYDPHRVLVDEEYALEALYETWLVQGRSAWYGCE